MQCFSCAEKVLLNIFIYLHLCKKMNRVRKQNIRQNPYIIYSSKYSIADKTTRKTKHSKVVGSILLFEEVESLKQTILCKSSLKSPLGCSQDPL